MFKIEKGIPLPTINVGGRKPKYPFDRLGVGDSFFVPGKTRSSMNSTVSSAAKRLGMKLVSSADTVGGFDGLRIWRVADDK